MCFKISNFARNYSRFILICMPITRYSGEPQVSVGIVSGEKICFSLNGKYAVNGKEAMGEQEASLANGFIHWDGKPYTELLFTPSSEDSSFSLKDVVIGVNFHWERKETQAFRGALRLRLGVDGTQKDHKSRIWAINELPVEQYLESVISSEMSATSNMPLLMAHAIISRSWLLNNMNSGKNAIASPLSEGEGQGERSLGVERLIRWYDHTAHTLFDVCADDHCQRYQGITMETSRNVVEAIHRTRGQILTYNGEICDARFSKCCGGAMEEFQYCWDDTPKPYLKGIGDTPSEKIPDLTIEENAEKWILSTPESFCNTNDKEILRQVLNDYDLETTDFYRWHVDYTQAELSALIRKKLGIDFGTILDLIPLKRGTSGRIYELKIVGTKRTMVIGKELEIRRALSESHLYSSAFVVQKRDLTPSPSPSEKGDAKPVAGRFRLIGAGWGHGAGLCQIGAAVMGAKGYSYDEILKHYYPEAELEKIWE